MLKKVPNYKVCTGPVGQLAESLGQGAYTFPVYGGACNQITPADKPLGALGMLASCLQCPYALPIAHRSMPPTYTQTYIPGTLSSVCTQNPFSGVEIVANRQSTGAGSAINVCAWSDWEGEQT